MAALKNIFFSLFKVMAILIGIIVVLLIGLFIYYLATIHSAQDYLPQDFLLYAEVNSIRDIYDNVIDLKAADVIFSTPELKLMYKAILEFKSQEFSRNILFRKLLEVKASVVIHDDYSPSLAFDLGFLSVATRMFPLINSVYKIKELKLNTYQMGDVTIYQYNPDPKQQIYFSLADNLIFVSTKKEHIETLYNNYESQKNLKNNQALVQLKDKLKKNGFIDLYISTNSVIKSSIQGNAELTALLKAISLNDLSALSFKISNKDLELNAFTNLKAKTEIPGNEAFAEFLSYNPASLRVIKYLSDKTNIYFSINFKSFKNLYNIVLQLQGQEFAKTMEEINNTCDFLFNASVDNLLFDWIGSEAGVFMMSSSPEPVLFLEIENKSKMEAAFTKLEKSIVFEESQSLVLDEVRINHIFFPGIIKRIVDSFQKGIETPYYIVMDDFIFFSTNPAGLADLSNHYRANKLLVQQENYKTLTRNLPKNANIFMYFDLSTTRPRFLEADNLLSNLLGLYEKGATSIYFTQNELKLNILADGIAGKKTLPFPGFPKPLENSANSDIICQDIKGSRIHELIYLDKDDNLVVQELGQETATISPTEKMSELLLTRDRLTGNYEIFAFAKSGTLFKFGYAGRPMEPYPLITNFKNSFHPLEVDGKLLFYAKSDKSLYLLDKETGEDTKLDLEIPNPILASPTYLDGVLAFHPKNFTGTVYLTDSRGKLLEGWPKDGGGVSYCSPLLYKNPNNELQVVFLTQAGVLNVWDKGGRSVNNFPVKLEGVYYANPAVTAFARNQPKGFLALNEQGKLTLIDIKGNIIKEKQLSGVNGQQINLLVFDLDSDGEQEIFIYGASNFIAGLDNKLETLPGFPVKGSFRPSFVDLNFDGKYELVAASYDNNLYVYTLNK